MAFDLSKYETVDSRIHDFYSQNPAGRINTEMEVIKDDFVVFKAYIYREHEDTLPAATGYCDGSRKNVGVDANFWLPNAETSAIGRALANLGLSAKGSRPSREEMEKVARVENDKKSEQITIAPVDSWETFTATMPAELETTTSNVIANLKETLGAEEIPQCVHGNRIKKQGTAKTGKPYLGWVCANGGGHVLGGVAPCPPIWYVYVSQTGTFRAPEQTE